MNFGVCDFSRLAVVDWRLRLWRLWFLALWNAPRGTHNGEFHHLNLHSVSFNRVCGWFSRLKKERLACNNMYRQVAREASGRVITPCISSAGKKEGGRFFIFLMPCMDHCLLEQMGSSSSRLWLWKPIWQPRWKSAAGNGRQMPTKAHCILLSSCIPLSLAPDTPPISFFISPTRICHKKRPTRGHW